MNDALHLPTVAFVDWLILVTSVFLVRFDSVNQLCEIDHVR